MHVIDQSNAQSSRGMRGFDPAPKRCGPWRIALCHHEPASASWLRAWLTRDGIEVHQAADAIELLDLIGERTLDGVVTSIDPIAHARGELDGLQALQMCRSAGMSLPFIVISDDPDLRVFHTITRVRGAVSLRAPFSPIDLVRLLEELGRGTTKVVNESNGWRRVATGGGES